VTSLVPSREGGFHLHLVLISSGIPSITCPAAQPGGAPTQSAQPRIFAIPRPLQRNLESSARPTASGRLRRRPTAVKAALRQQGSRDDQELVLLLGRRSGWETTSDLWQWPGRPARFSQERSKTVLDFERPNWLRKRRWGVRTPHQMGLSWESGWRTSTRKTLWRIVSSNGL